MKNDQFVTLAEVARRFKVPPHRITYLYTSGKLEEPATRLGNRRAFSAQDIARIEMALAKKEAHG
jgi:DNA-binding transcriptional MerR regulator